MHYKIYDTDKKEFLPREYEFHPAALLALQKFGKVHYKIVSADKTIEECAEEHNMSLRDRLRHDEKEKA